MPTMCGSLALTIGDDLALPLTFLPLRPDQIARWDSLIAEFPRRTVYHSKAWFQCLVETQNVEWRYWAVTDHGRVVGYFAGGITRRGPFRILGSPLRTWRTNHIGPLLEEGVNPEAFVQALNDLARAERLSMVEIEYPGMPHAAYEAAGFECHQTWTNTLPLSPNLERMLRNTGAGRRHGIRRAQRYGLEVVDCDGTGTIVHDQLTRTLLRKGALCPFPVEFSQAVERNLKPAGLLYSLGVRSPQGEIVAVGLFPRDHHTVYLWECSSELKGRNHKPNDLLHWGLICRAAVSGLQLYNMSGYGRFNYAFGTNLEAVHRWNKCYSLSARAARRVYEGMLKLKRRRTPLSGLMDPVLK
jgi:hypothetical protein